MTMPMAEPGYRSLVAWQRADELFIHLHRVVKQAFPLDERFTLAAQLRRAALSVPANIVEGTARYHPGEMLHFLRIAWASLAEVGCYIHVAHRLGYLSGGAQGDLEREIRQVAAPLSGLIKRLQLQRGAAGQRPMNP